MLHFLTNYGGTLAVGMILAVVIAAVIFRLWRNHKKGRPSCSCGCDGCGHACSCGTENGITRPKQENHQ